MIDLSLGLYGKTFSGPSGPWTPGSITTEVWIDASDTSTITHSGGDVSQIDDKSGNLRHLTQSDEAKQPLTGTRTQNSLNVLDFDGTMAMQSALVAPTVASPITFFFAAKRDVSGLNQYLFDTIWEPAYSDRLSMFNSGANEVLDGGSVYFPGAVTTAFMYGCAIFNGTSSALYVNGSQVGSNGNAGTEGFDGLSIMSRYDEGGGCDGFMGEIFVVNQAADSDLRDLADTYFSDKWVP